MKNSLSILVAFVSGQIIQAILCIVAKSTGLSQSTAVIVWASAAGLVISIAMVVGMWIVSREFAPKQQHARRRSEAVDDTEDGYHKAEPPASDKHIGSDEWWKDIYDGVRNDG